MPRTARTIQETVEKPRSAIEELGNALEKNKQKKELKNLTLFTAFLVSATAGRALLQFVPSVEPIIPFAILAGIVLGSREGFSVGAGAYVASNFFVWGLQGPWTLFQCIGAAVPGAIAGLAFRDKKPSAKKLVLWTIAGTIFFEFVMNISGALMGIGILPGAGLLLIPLYFVTSLPFSAVHLASNAGFALLFSPLLKLWRKPNELEIISISRVAGNRRTDIRLYKKRE